MTRIAVSIPNSPENSTEVFTSEAIAGLVGQQPKVVAQGDFARLVGLSEVIAAEEAEGAILLTLDVRGPAIERYSLTEGAHAGLWSIGYRRQTEPNRPPVRAFAVYPIIEPEENRVTIPQRDGPQPPLVTTPDPPDVRVAARFVREDIYQYANMMVGRQSECAPISSPEDARMLAEVLPWQEWADFISVIRAIRLRDYPQGEALTEALDRVDRVRRSLHALDDGTAEFEPYPYRPESPGGTAS